MNVCVCVLRKHMRSSILTSEPNLQEAGVFSQVAQSRGLAVEVCSMCPPSVLPPPDGSTHCFPGTTPPDLIHMEVGDMAMW